MGLSARRLVTGGSAVPRHPTIILAHCKPGRVQGVKRTRPISPKGNAKPHGFAGHAGSPRLTFHPDHSMKAGHRSSEYGLRHPNEVDQCSGSDFVFDRTNERGKYGPASTPGNHL